MKKVSIPILLVCLLVSSAFFIYGCSGNSLSGKYETNVENTGIGPIIEFSGNNFAFLRKDGTKMQGYNGTYTISGNRIEFVFSNGARTYSFSRDGANSITVNTFIFSRKK